MSLRDSFPVIIHSIADGLDTTVCWGRQMTYLQQQHPKGSTPFYGSFEIFDPKDDYGYYAEGGLWYTRLPDGQYILDDYDGVFSLPATVKAILREFHFQMDDTF